MSHIRVMAIDDSALTREVIGLLLAGDGEIQLAASADSAGQAIVVLRTSDIDVITLDLELPDMDGLDLLSRFTAQDACGVVVVSGDPRKHERALELGATACFEKLHLMNERGNFLEAIRQAAGRLDEPRLTKFH
jgi:two-component system chemotaxis response regulator CheB